MKLHLWGTDFRRGSAELRSRLFCAPENRSELVKNLLELGFRDLIPLFTCNRIEFYTTADDYFADTRRLWVKMLERVGLREEHYFEGYQLEGKAALRHLLRVASSLESMVVGEPQILGQLKDALTWVRQQGFPLDPSLDRAFQYAFETAKGIRTQTAIGEKSVSVASLGLKHLQRMEATRPLSKAVVVGRSHICVLAVQWLKKNRPEVPVIWVNRDPERLKQYVESQGTEIVGLSEFLESPADFSHLITATSASEPVFSSRWLSRFSKPLTILDFAQPPDVERQGLPASVLVIRLEDLKGEAEANALERVMAVQQAEDCIEAALKRFCQEQKEAPLLKEFSRVEPDCLGVLDEALGLIAPEVPKEVFPIVEKWAKTLVKRQLHQSREHLRGCLRKVTEPEARFGGL